MLIHVSEEPDIQRFEPRAGAAGSEPFVWAIEARRLCNYLVPRDCPRVTYYAGCETTVADIERFLGASDAVIAIEEGWYARLRDCRLYCYHLPPSTFECRDECAGYYVSREPVAPVHVEVVKDPVAELRRRGADLRVMPTLWPLRDAVIGSTLQFSIIRMRNAAPRGA